MSKEKRTNYMSNLLGTSCIDYIFYCHNTDSFAWLLGDFQLLFGFECVLLGDTGGPEVWYHGSMIIVFPV